MKSLTTDRALLDLIGKYSERRKKNQTGIPKKNRQMCSFWNYIQGGNVL